MENLIIQMYESGKSKPEKVVTIPISKLTLAKKFLPAQTMKFLRKEGMDIGSLDELANKTIGKGTLIEVETGKDKVVISVE